MCPQSNLLFQSPSSTYTCHPKEHSLKANVYKMVLKQINYSLSPLCLFLSLLVRSATYSLHPLLLLLFLLLPCFSRFHQHTLSPTHSSGNTTLPLLAVPPPCSLDLWIGFDLSAFVQNNIVTTLPDPALKIGVVTYTVTPSGLSPSQFHILN